MEVSFGCEPLLLTHFLGRSGCAVAVSGGSIASHTMTRRQPEVTRKRWRQVKASKCMCWVIWRMDSGLIYSVLAYVFEVMATHPPQHHWDVDLNRADIHICKCVKRYICFIWLFWKRFEFDKIWIGNLIFRSSLVAQNASVTAVTWARVWLPQIEFPNCFCFCTHQHHIPLGALLFLF